MTIIVISEPNGDIIACRAIADEVANDERKNLSIHDLAEYFCQSIDFIFVNEEVLPTAEAAHDWIRELNQECADKEDSAAGGPSR